MFHPLCGFSLQKGARIIAIVDLVICFVCTTFRFVAYDYMEYSEYEIETEFYTSNGTSLGDLSDDAQHNATAVDIHDEEYSANVTAHLLEILKQNNVISDEHHEHYLFITIAAMIITGIIYLVYLCLEVWLCRLLLRASNNRDGSACKTWFWFRLFITFIFLMCSIVGIATFKHDWVDWVLEPLNIYRIYELIVVNEFKREIAATSGRVKLRA